MVIPMQRTGAHGSPDARGPCQSRESARQCWEALYITESPIPQKSVKKMNYACSGVRWLQHFGVQFCQKASSLKQPILLLTRYIPYFPVCLQ